MKPVRRAVLLAIAMVTALIPTAPAAIAATGPAVFVNEFHYDNSGTDAGEAIEIAGPAGTDLTGWSIVLYNGANGLAYNTTPLSGVLPDQQSGFGTTVVTYPSNGIQNGGPDGIALIDASSTVVQFLSYEGSFVAADGPANGTMSTDIGVAESSSTAVGESLQLTGTGTMGGDFAWSSPQPQTFGAINSGQSFGSAPAAPPVINEFSASTTGADFEYIEIYGTPGADLSNLTVLEIEGDGFGAGFIDGVFPVGTLDASGFGLISLPADAIENGTVSLLLVDSFTGSEGVDLDTDNDGVLDSTPWSEVVDDVAVTDGGSDIAYAAVALGPNYDGLSGFKPGGASRIPDGADTNSTGDWVRNDFDLFGIHGFGGSPVVGEAVNTPGAPNELIVPPPTGFCGAPATLISAIQGAGDASPLVGETHTIEGVVVGDFQDDVGTNGDLNGFFVQEEDADNDAKPATSEGIFVFQGSNPTVDVANGDLVRVVGSVSEFFDATQISATAVLVCGQTDAPTPATVTLPVDSFDRYEEVEGMSIVTRADQDLYISEYFNFDRFNEIVLTPERLYQPTAIFDPGSTEAADLADLIARSRLTLDDGRTSQNPDPARHPNGDPFTLDNRFRGGDILRNVVGVMDYSFGLYRIQPTAGATYIEDNPRPAAPDGVGGSITVAAFNVLNYFNTLDYPTNDPRDNACGPEQDQGCRGADDENERTRQLAKIVAAMAVMDADVLGIIEVENTKGVEAMEDIVDGLNALDGVGPYAFIETGTVGRDVIKVGFIYQPASVTPVGDFAVLDDPAFVSPFGGEDRNRAALAQTFLENATGGKFTAVVNHFKSKSGSELDDFDDGIPVGICVDADPDNDVPDCDQGDGQGYFNATRTAAAQALADWLKTDPTGSGDPDVMIIGDLNAYDKEDPIDALRAAGYVDLLGQYQGELAYSFVFDSQLGYLDYGMANASLIGQVTGTTAWHINADEPDLIDYDTSFKRPAQDAIYAPDQYRSSDHDPVIVGLDLNASPVCDTAEPSIDSIWPPNHKMVDIEILGCTDADGDAITITIDSIFQDEPVNEKGDGNTAPDGDGIGTSIAQVRAERSGKGDGRVYHIAFTATDKVGNTTTGEVTVEVRKSISRPAVDGGAIYDSTIVP